MKKSLTLSLAAAALLAGLGLAGSAQALDVSTDTGITAGAGGSRSDINARINTGAEAGAGTVGSSGVEPAMPPPPPNGLNNGPYTRGYMNTDALGESRMQTRSVAQPGNYDAGVYHGPRHQYRHHARHHAKSNKMMTKTTTKTNGATTTTTTTTKPATK